MVITLTPDQERFVTEQLSSGRYKSAADIVNQGIGIMRAQEQFIQSNRDSLRERIDSGIGQIRRGEVVDGGKAIEAIRAKLAKRRRKGE